MSIKFSSQKTLRVCTSFPLPPSCTAINNNYPSYFFSLRFFTSLLHSHSLLVFKQCLVIQKGLTNCWKRGGDSSRRRGNCTAFFQNTLSRSLDKLYIVHTITVKWLRWSVACSQNHVMEKARCSEFARESRKRDVLIKELEYTSKISS